jgi:RNA polymerase sigma factor (sigma-70 family)
MERTEAELIAAVLKGDAASFEPLIEKYSPRIFATARRYARRESEVEDIAQEIWLKAFQKLASFRADAPFEHWLMRLAVHVCYDFLRGHQRNRESAFSELTGPEQDWLEQYGERPESAGAPDHHAARNRGSFGERNRAADRVVPAAGQSARLPGPRRNAKGAGQNRQRPVSVTHL